MEIKTPTPVYERVVEIKGGRMHPQHLFEVGEEQKGCSVVTASNGKNYVVEEELDIS